jgi:hypothetical protein
MLAESASRRPARVCLFSLRGANTHAAWCSNYEFEDVISEVDDVDMVVAQPGDRHRQREWLVRRLIWRRGLRNLTPYLNPGLRPMVLDRQYDLFVFVCMNPADLVYLSALDGWHRCRTKICFMVEFYSGWVSEYAYHMRLLRAFDQVALCFGGSVDSVRAATGRPCHHVPLGVDVLRFTPYPTPAARTIDVYSMGRRSEAAHRRLLDMASRREIFYIYDTIPGLLIQPRDHRQHRDLVANCAKRSQFFMAYPAKVDEQAETRGQSEVGARFFEGAAAGAILIGQKPTASSFDHDFNWPEPVIDIGSSAESLMAALQKFTRDPISAAALRRRSAIAAIRRFDWSYRWRRILDMAGLPASDRLLSRQAALQNLAAAAEASPLENDYNTPLYGTAHSR